MTAPPTDLHWNTNARLLRKTPLVSGVETFHRSMPGYHLTPIASFPDLASDLGVADVIAKIETDRLGLPAFKVLGASWALRCEFVRRGDLGDGATFQDLVSACKLHPDLTLVAASAGNHGRAVAHVARLVGARAAVFVPADTARARIEAIGAEGADVRILPGTYDDAVVHAASLADDNHLVLADTSWPGYERIPRDIVDGYQTMFTELDEQLDTPPTHLVVQMGVGSLGEAATAAALRWRATALVSVEPTTADGVLESLRAGRPTPVAGPHRSAMAGLNAGNVSINAWPALQNGIDLAIAIDDDAAFAAMRMLATEDIMAGATGAAGLGGLLALRAMPEWDNVRKRLRMDRRSRVVVLITDGVTDPDIAEQVFADTDAS